MQKTARPATATEDMIWVCVVDPILEFINRPFTTDEKTAPIPTICIPDKYYPLPDRTIRYILQYLARAAEKAKQKPIEREEKEYYFDDLQTVAKGLIYVLRKRGGIDDKLATQIKIFDE